MKYYLLLIYLSFSLLACKDPCKDIVCNNGGDCLNGTCYCPTGYSGTHCEIADPCLSANCNANSHCVNGICVCNNGYEGSLCDIRTSLKFEGNYTVNDTCGFTAPNSYATLVSDTSADLISLKFRYLWYFNADILGYINTDGNSFNIPTQTVSTSFGSALSISGTGTHLSNGDISINYIADGDHCHGIMVKQ